MEAVTTVEAPTVNLKFTVDPQGMIHTTDPVIDRYLNVKKMAEEAIIQAFEKAEIGFTEVGQMLGFDSNQKAKEWLESKGANTWRKSSPEIEEAAEESLKILDELIPDKKN